MAKRQTTPPPKPKPIAGYTPGSFPGSKTTDKSQSFNPAAQSVGGSAPEKPKAPSLLGQVSGFVQAIPSGIGHMGADAYRSVNNAVLDTGSSLKHVTQPSKDPLLQNWDKTKGRYPLIENQRASFVRTGMDVRHPERFAEAVRNGTIVGKVAEDLANASIAAAGASGVASGAAKLGVPGAETAASGLSQAARLGAEVGNPAKVFTVPLKAIDKASTLFTPGGEALSSAIPRIIEGAATGNHPWIEEAFPQSTTRGRVYSGLMDQLKDRTAQAQRHARVHGEAAAHAAPNLDEQVAADLLDTGQAHVLAAMPKELPPETLARYAQAGIVDPESRFAVTPEAAQLARDAAAGTLDNETMARIEGYRAPMQKLAIERQGSLPVNPEDLPTPRVGQAYRRPTSLEGTGALGRGSIGPDQLGFQPLESAQKRYEEAGLPPATAEDHAITDAPSRTRQALQTGRMAQQDMYKDALNPALDSVSQKALRDAADQIPTTLAMLEANGIDPIHLIGGGSEDISLGTGRQMPRRIKPLSEQKMKETALSQRGAAARTRLEAQRATQIIRDDVGRQMEQMIGKKPVDIGVETEGLSSQAIVLKMHERGFSPLVDRPGQQYGANSLFVPSSLAKSFQREINFSLADRAVGWRALGKVNRAWKMAVLPFNPKWQIGNNFGNMIMGTLGAGETPLSLLRQFNAARAGLHGETIPARLLDADIVGSEARGIKNLGAGELATESRSRIARAADISYRANTVVDEMYRSMVYLAKKERGYSDEVAVREALHALGDFSNMNTLERGYIREVIPFYAWMRHITQLAFRLPIEHPMRVAWTLNLANQYGDDQNSQPGFQRGGVFWNPNTWVPTSNLNPLGDVVQRSPLTHSGLGAAVSPGIKVPLQILTGVDMSHGFQQSTRPPGMGYGQHNQGPILDPNAIGSILVNQVPIARGVRDVVQGPGMRYGGTGQLIRDSKTGEVKVPENVIGGRFGAMARTLLPWPRHAVIGSDTTAPKTAKAKKSNTIAGYTPGSFGGSNG